MAEQKYISVKVSGRPSSSGGYNPLAAFNNPQFIDADPKYVGFDHNPYFFTVRLTKLCAVYKLIVNKVFSNGASRVGKLLISISIPPGYKLDAEMSPYTVLMELFHAFAEKYLTVRDSQEQSYEFNRVKVPLTAMDEFAQKYTLVPDSAPYHIMNYSGSKGYVTLPEDKIAELLSDVQYPEFDKYSEVIVAEHYSATGDQPSEETENSDSESYEYIGDIEVPRKPAQPVVEEKADENVTDFEEEDTDPGIKVKQDVNLNDTVSDVEVEDTVQTEPRDLVPVQSVGDESRVIAIVLRLNAKRIISANRRLRVEVRVTDGKGNYGVALCTDVMFSDPDVTGICEGRFYIPNTWEDYVVSIAYSARKIDYITNGNIDLHSATVTLTDANFKVEVKSFFKDYQRYLILAGGLVVMFLLGVIAGIGLHRLLTTLT